MNNATVKFSLESSVLNKMNEVSGDNYELIPTISLEEIIKQNNLSKVDLVKLDIEGAEYDIVKNLNNKTTACIKEFRMEYHLGEPDIIIDKLNSLGFEVTHTQVENDTTGNIYFIKN
jgi:hypothetical protein